MRVARHIRIEGLVQGVCFRDWTVDTARSLGVTGWVRNRSDGSVEVMAVGAAETLEPFINRLRQGSSASRVDRIKVEEAPVQEFEGFTRAATV